MPTIKRDIPIPIYYQLKEHIKAQIARGELKPGDRLPTEEELCARYGISRTPVRQALTELVREGLLTRTPGRGTFVAAPSSEQGVSSIRTLRVVVSDVRWQEPLEQAADLWNTEYPDQPVTLVFQNVPVPELRSTLIAAVGRGEAPDISVLDSVWVAEFAHRYYLYALDEVDPAWVRSSQGDFFAAMLAANRYRGRLYGVPIAADVTVLWYRRDWLSAEGFSPPLTWEELVTVGRHFQQPDVRRRYGLGPHPLVFVGGRRGSETTTYQLLPFLWSFGGNLVVDDQVVLDSPQSRRAFAFLQALVHEYRLVPPEVVSYSWDQAIRLFALGKAALALGGTYEGFFIRQAAGWDEEEFLHRVGFVPIPAGPGGRPATLVGGMSYVLYRQSKAPQQAMALLERTGSLDVLKPFCGRTGHIPPRVSVANRFHEDSFLAQTIPLLEQARVRPALPEYARVSELFQALVEEILTKQRPLEEAVTLAAEKISAVTGLPIGRPLSRF